MHCVMYPHDFGSKKDEVSFIKDSVNQIQRKHQVDVVSNKLQAQYKASFELVDLWSAYVQGLPKDAPKDEKFFNIKGIINEIHTLYEDIHLRVNTLLYTLKTIPVDVFDTTYYELDKKVGEFQQLVEKSLNTYR